MHTSWNPFDQLESMFDRIQTDVRGNWENSFGLPSVTVDVMNDGDAYTVVADMPGVETDDIDLGYHDRVLTLTADSTRETGDENSHGDEHVVTHERRHTRFERSVPLKDPVAFEAATATYTNGVLTVTLPKGTPTDDKDAGIDIDIE